MVTGAIVYDLLKQENPGALVKILELLQKHPQFEELFVSKLKKVDAEARDRAILMLAARWPDDIRKNPTYDQPKWHYIDFPFKPKGQPDSVAVSQPDEINAVVAFRTNLEILSRPESTDAEKAIAICWIMHIVGDIHQPLHTVSLFTTDYPAPEGDRGGNSFKIRARQGNATINLHSFWDELITGGESFREMGKKAIELRIEYPPSKLKELGPRVNANDIDRWVQESFQMAQLIVYRQGKLRGSPKEESAPVLPEGYSKQVQPLAQRRAVLASYRLAGTLVGAISPATAKKSN